MQEIKVQVKQVQGNGLAMLINGQVIASVYNDCGNAGREDWRNKRRHEISRGR